MSSRLPADTARETQLAADELTRRLTTADSFGVSVEEVIDVTAEFDEALARVSPRQADGEEVRRATLAELLPVAERLSRGRHPRRWAAAEAAERRRFHAERTAITPAAGRRTGARPRGAGRPAARRPSSARAGPSSESDDPEPGEARTRPRAFARIHALTPGLSGAARLRLFGRLPQPLQAACWRDLREHIDRERTT